MNLQLSSTIVVCINSIILHKFSENSDRIHSILDNDKYENFVEEYLQNENFNKNSHYPAEDGNFVAKSSEFMDQSSLVGGCCPNTHTRINSYKGCNHNFNFNYIFKSPLNKNLYSYLPDMHRNSRPSNSEPLLSTDCQLRNNSTVIHDATVHSEKASNTLKYLSDSTPFNIASKATAVNPLNNQISTCQGSNKTINTINSTISKDLSTNENVLLPDYSRRSCNNTEDANKLLLPNIEQRLGNSYYISKLNDRIYHLSDWERSESSNSHAEACLKFSRSDPKEALASILTTTLDLKSGGNHTNKEANYYDTKTKTTRYGHFSLDLETVGLRAKDIMEWRPS